MLSILLTSMSYTFWIVVSKPSKINNGAEEPSWKDPLPRIVNSGNVLGLDPITLFSVILKPASNALSVVKIFAVCTFCKSSFLIVVTAPANPSVLRVKYPLTTTSSISAISAFIVTFTSLRSPTVICWVSIPTKENTKVNPSCSGQFKA